MAKLKKKTKNQILITIKKYFFYELTAILFLYSNTNVGCQGLDVIYS
jgi:hypothetical protein